MRFFHFCAVTLVFTPAVPGTPSRASAQTLAGSSPLRAPAEFPDAPEPQSGRNQLIQQRWSSGNSSAKKHRPPPQPHRILGLAPNYRAMSAGVMPPPPTPRQAFKIATQNSFDYSASEIFGLGTAQAISLTYYPNADRSLDPFLQKYGLALTREAISNVFREFWPDIAAHARHHHRSSLPEPAVP